ncbi:hypothetical protein ASG37_04955 [Sphingomonas sp. Leaf407]|uniref:hypothetical protein n=1 Tax=unclassified Sphingomonas TaxID=196159 RepID=UPI0006F79290|nr:MULTISPECIES: hypothetical protein [unclassified Sphingomonas]KQN37012.1 hypothetical protein ASE97_10870 [Sphingomonas sp. Leaf42]KQT30439.1 hypothetical protein ASG37_04955 [Sphingomonas sp. Leaf407]
MQIKMTAGLSGPDYSLSPGDSVPFDDVEGQRLIDAGFAELDADKAVVGETTTPVPVDLAKAKA